ncbi:2,3-bisphosphoglycerate-independent phosphoglycerate mutase [Permianibacter aggregans]|uniref:2,3-bisphosphoglycerate-independent phosphoglycerate mutase n=1 Tax=Permianibacter aggregans TaxID=1510150 RepID=A0A4R6UPB3_9GAMM|nr:2,3-bisphosphoglycerate-independent phosphoglycerate mutase [Permianibacter aggregans]QGX40137.1 2,3-bisphosphoglycerate-independent phosphoglycerate mutase [Permianibacter aggregans]TDQ49048.1 phosphoglycerate mutase [Permianibacter aggregans]
MSVAPKPMVLIVLDGWGYRENPQDNAILAANTPNWDRLWARYPHTLISGSGEDVGLPAGQFGNSEVGHINLGAGRIVYQELTRISKAIRDGEFVDNPAFTTAIDNANKHRGVVHIMGLLSAGGVHSHEEHLFAAVEMAVKRGAKAVYLHAFLDGRDTPPRSAEGSLQAAEKLCAQYPQARVASIIGRYFAMDRDKRWDRVQAAYELLTTGKAEFTADSAVEGLQQAYARGENDEFVKATRIGEPVSIEAGDALLFMNFRADRARQISRAFVDDQFDGFARNKIAPLYFVQLTQYAADIPAPVAFAPTSLNNTLGQWLQDHGKTQLRIAETEKYAHVTFFFNGGVEQTFNGEQRIMVNSPSVATYDLQPEMSAAEVTDKMVDAIENQRYDVIICNYANADMVGHTGVFEAAVKAIETLDVCLGRIATALEKVGGEALITADHGNAEQMHDHDVNQPHTQHTTEAVPLLYIGRNADVAVQDGVLSDIAPTLLHLIGMPVPKEMTGRPIFRVK